MIKNYFIYVALLIFAFAKGQVGIGTTNPRGALDINQPTTHNMGLVLPTNASEEDMVNPAGEEIAEGTIFYDSVEKCVKFYNGSIWQCMGQGAPAEPSLVADCAVNGFEGTYRNTGVTNATFSVTLTNNSFYEATVNFGVNDLELSGTNGDITVNAVSPTQTTLGGGQSQTITYSLSGNPGATGTLTGTWTKLSLSCTNSVEVEENRTARVAYLNSASLGSSGTGMAPLNSQLNSSANYGPSGTYSGIDGFSFTDIASTINNLTAEDLLNNYDLISVGAYPAISTANAAKIKAFVDGGGVALILIDINNTGRNAFLAFGGTGPTPGGSGNNNTSNNNAINNGVFGDARNVSLDNGNFAQVFANQLPTGTTVLATRDNNNQSVFVTGEDGRAVFSTNIELFTSVTSNNTTSFSGTVIDAPHEIFAHNLIAYLLEKKGFVN